jgi:DNA-binding CsgD family transcriptional regulator
MPTGTAVVPVVAVCDPRGIMLWTNHPDPVYVPGVPVWQHAAEESREQFKDRVSRAAFLNEPQEFEVRTKQGELFHVWVWPMLTANLGVCIVGMLVPPEIAQLTTRERECLVRLARGKKTSEIAEEFDVSLSTVHTYLKRAREKLNLPSIEHLIGYASRHLSPPPPQLPLPLPKHEEGDA